jgi:hypothetical protein
MSLIRTPLEARGVLPTSNDRHLERRGSKSRGHGLANHRDDDAQVVDDVVVLEALYVHVERCQLDVPREIAELLVFVNRAIEISAPGHVTSSAASFIE